ncbi:MAG: hypothetical protein JO270_16980, partial [Acidobacteriaceae bacterium]|nr:hypothetical protein [Acidobacteriaceae bacterium]
MTVTSDGTRSKAKPVVLAQDGQSRIETAIYDYLWAQGREVDTDTREIRIGYRELANSIHPRIHRNRSRNNLESLRKKLAIDSVGREDANGTGRTYRVYGYKTILKRRREAGLIWYTEGREGSRLLSVSDVTVTSEGTVLSS